MATDGTDILTPGEVARFFGVHPDTVRRWADKKTLASFKLPSGRVRFWRADVEAFLAEQAEPEPASA